MRVLLHVVHIAPGRARASRREELDQVDLASVALPMARGVPLELPRGKPPEFPFG